MPIEIRKPNRTERRIGAARRKQRLTYAQQRAQRTLHAAMMLLALGLVLLVPAFFAMRFELTAGLDHTTHPCHPISLFAVCGMFGGLAFTGLGGWFMIFGDDA